MKSSILKLKFLLIGNVKTKLDAVIWFTAAVTGTKLSEATGPLLMPNEYTNVPLHNFITVSQ
jgi:hypothetical protein